MANKCTSCTLETHCKFLRFFKPVCNRPNCSLNISEDGAGYQEDSPKRVSRCYGCQNLSTESSK